MRMQRLSTNTDSTHLEFSIVLLITLLLFSFPFDVLALTKPTLNFPANNAVITTSSYTFSWSHPYNDEYEIKIKTNGGTLKYASGRMTSKSKTVNLAGVGLTPGSTYKWYIVLYALGQEDSSVDRWFTYNPIIPGAVSVSPGSGAWTSSPKYVSVSSSNASQIYYTIRTTSDGSTPVDPPEPTTSTNDGYVSGSSGTFQIYASAGQNKKLKVRFRGYRSSGYGSVTGSYLYSINLASAADDHGNSCSTATTMDVNSSKSGAIGVAGDYDYFKVTVPSAGTLTAYSTGSTDTYGYLKSSSCTTIKSDDDAGEGNNFSFTQTVASGGTYYIAVRHYSSSTVGPYSLRVNFAQTPSPSDDHGNSCSTATTMGINSTKAGTLGVAGDYDYFKVTLPSAGTLTAYSTGSTDTYGYLKNSSCTTVKSNDDAGEGSNFSFSQTLSSGGTYYIAARHYYTSTGVGSYSLRVNFGVNPSAVSVNPSSGVWTSSPKLVNVSSTNANRIYYTIRTTTNGSTPADPPEPTSSVNDGSITGSSGTFQIYANAGQNKKIKVRFRGYNSSGYSATTSSFLYSINLNTNSDDRFTWPVDPTNRTDGTYTGTVDAQTIELSLGQWYDAQPFQKYYYSTATKKYGFHLGADYNKSGGDLNLNVYPTANGTVSGVYPNASKWGNVIFVKHITSFGTYTSMYAHVNWLNSGKPAQNSRVTSTQPIALIGTGGGLYPSHLHFEIRRGESTSIGYGYTQTKCSNSSDNSSNSCGNNNIDPNEFIRAHN